MVKKTRMQRVEEYRTNSREIDAIDGMGKKIDAADLASEWMEKARSAGDEDYALFFKAEVANFSEQDYDKAILLMEKGFAWQKEKGLKGDSFLRRCMGVYCSFKGKEDKAIEWYEEALTANPKDSETMREKGTWFLKKGDLDKSIEWYDKALKVSPNNSDAMRQKGVSFSKKGDENKAIEWYDKALNVNPKDSAAMRNKGVSLLRNGVLDKAIELYDKALKVNQKDWNAMREKGNYFAIMGHKNKAIEWIDKALKINPNDSFSYQSYSAIEFNNGEFSESLASISKAVRLNREAHKGDFQFVCGAIGLDWADEWEKLFGKNVKEEKKEKGLTIGEKRLPELQGFIVSIREAYKQETEIFQIC